MLISIAGNIGAGKSSLTSILHEQYGWQPLFEPLLENPYLVDFYSDMSAFAYQSQVYFLAKQCAALEHVPEGKAVAVQDRSIYEDAEIFTALLYDLGHIDDRDYATYATMYRGIRNIIPPPSAVFYLRSDTDTLMDNIRKRGREFEHHLERSYIENLNRRYDYWAEHFDDCPLHILDAGKCEFIYDTQAREEIMYTIKHLSYQ